jgi:HAD superfamily hydrolase (TIGR01459 family)
MHPNQPIFLSSISDVTNKHDAFILDLWGVVHDGKNLYPGAKECLVELRKAGKKITFLSNAPRRAKVVEQTLAGMGVDRDLYDAIITSGEVAYLCLEHPEQSPFKPRGNKYIYIGLERDRLILEGLHYEEVLHPEHAQFIMLSHSFEDNQPLKTLHPLLEKCVKLHLPVVCINPDKEVVRLTGERVYCAGALAEEYRMMGGEVVYFGKPHRTVYEYALATLQGAEHTRILAVGDSLSTDILGGQRTRLTTMLVTGGVLREMLGDAKAPDFNAKCTALFEREQVAPDYVVAALTCK